MDEPGGMIFNIQTYAIHDGPGIRTTVFLKGCPLTCVWCQNPESQSSSRELLYDRDRCTGCGLCVSACPHEAITVVDGKSRTDRSRCDASGQCAGVCPNEARSIVGNYLSVEEVFEQVAADRNFYERSGGGVTLSGGEPAAQPAFAGALLARCKAAGIHTALDTCGFARWDVLDTLLNNVDLVLFDLKHMDPQKHRDYTGVLNDLILDNAHRIYHDRKLPMRIRIPVVPGFNATPENLAATARFVVESLGKDVPVHLLPYHGLGDAKYERLEHNGTRPAIPPPEEERMREFKVLMESFGLAVYRGG